jgi:hypothetical protein
VIGRGYVLNEIKNTFAVARVFFVCFCNSMGGIGRNSLTKREDVYYNE